MVTFDQAAESYLEAGGSPRFLGHFDQVTQKWHGLMGKLYGVSLKSITQAYLDQVARELHPKVRPETLNRIVYTPFVAIWNHGVTNEWADHRRWKRPNKKRKGTRRTLEARVRRVGSYPTTYERAVKFVLAMSPANAIIMTILFYTGNVLARVVYRASAQFVARPTSRGRRDHSPGGRSHSKAYIPVRSPEGRIRTIA